MPDFQLPITRWLVLTHTEMVTMDGILELLPMMEARETRMLRCTGLNVNPWVRHATITPLEVGQAVYPWTFKSTRLEIASTVPGTFPPPRALALDDHRTCGKREEHRWLHPIP